MARSGLLYTEILTTSPGPSRYSARAGLAVSAGAAGAAGSADAADSPGTALRTGAESPLRTEPVPHPAIIKAAINSHASEARRAVM